MLYTQELRDGALAILGGSARGMAVVGPASAGPVNEVVTITDPRQALDTFVSGPLAARCARALKYAPGPLYAVRCATSISGTISTVTKRPASAGVPYTIYGTARLEGAALNGDIEFQGLDKDVSFTVAPGGATGWALSEPQSKNVVLTVATGATAAQVETAYLATPAVVALGTLRTFGDKAGTVGTSLSRVDLNNGAITYTPLGPDYFLRQIATGGAAGASFGAPPNDKQLTASSAVNADGQPTSTATAVMSAVAAVGTNKVTVDGVGTGAGIVGLATSFVPLQYGSTGALSVLGTPVDRLDVRIEITRDGALGTAAFKYSLDGGDTYTPEIAIPVGGIYQPPLTGLIFSFGGIFEEGDGFTFTTAAPAASTGDLLAALGVLKSDANPWEFVHLVGALSGAQALGVESWIQECWQVGRRLFVLGEGLDNSSSQQTVEQWKAMMLAAYGAITSPRGQLVIVAGYCEAQLADGSIQRRSLAWPVGEQILRVPLQQHPGQPQDSGPLRGIFKPPGRSGISHDERVSPGLGGPTGRLLTVQTLVGDPNRYYVGDFAGLRSPGTLAGPTSDYSLLMNVRVIMEAARVIDVAGQNELARTFATKRDGTLLESEANKLDGRLTLALEQGIVAPGYAVSAYVRVSRTWNLLSTKKLPLKYYVRPFGYALWVEVEGGFEAVTAAAA